MGVIVDLLKMDANPKKTGKIYTQKKLHCKNEDEREDRKSRKIKGLYILFFKKRK